VGKYIEGQMRRFALRIPDSLRDKMRRASEVSGLVESDWARQALDKQADVDMATDQAARARTSELRRLGKSMVAPPDCVHPRDLRRKGVFQTYCGGCGEAMGPT
jgi:hypothetical protein